MASGSIRRAKGRSGWEMRVDAGRDPQTGGATDQPVLQGQARGGGGLAAAGRVRGGEHAGSDATFGELLERWFEMRSPDWSPKTVLEHRRFIDKRLAPALGRVPLRKLRSEDLDIYYARLRKSGRQGGRPLSPASVRRVHVVVHAALQQAVKWRWLPYNPADGASPPSAPQADIRPPAARDVARLLELATAADPEFGLFLRLAAVTGTRRGTLCALRYRDVDVERRRVTIARSIVEGPDGIEEKDTKTHLVHRVTVDQHTLDLLAAHRLRMAERALACGVRLRDDAYVFSYEPDCSKPWRPDGITHRFRRVRAEAGLPNMRVHDLRHWVGTQLGDAGVPIATIAGRLGHSRNSTTLDMYTKSLAASDDLAAGILAALIDGPASPAASTTPS